MWFSETPLLLDKIKALGFRARLLFPLVIWRFLKKRKEYLEEAEAAVDIITIKRGLMTDEERHNKVIETWNITNNKITTALLAGLGKYNNIYMMANSGARGSNSQIKQLVGMRGLMANTVWWCRRVAYKSKLP